jgi:peptide subunit release factor 1 (eRF1)
MEASGPTPVGALRAEDVPDVTDALDAPGPFLTVVLTTEGDVENAAQRCEVRWKNLRDDVAADEAALSAVDALVSDAHHDGDALAVVANAHGMQIVEHAPDPPARDVARWAPLPALGPVLEWRQGRVPYLVVDIDRTGADLVVVVTRDRRADRRDEDEEHVEGREFPVRKPKPGGWSQRRYQQRAENTWKENASNVAEAIAKLVDEHGVELVLVDGDARALQLLDEAMPEAVRQRVRHVKHARAADGGVDEVSPEIRRQVASAVAERTVGMLRKFEEELGQADRAANGPSETLSALARAQVDVLLVHDDLRDDRTAFFGPEPLEVAATAAELRDLGIEDVQEGRLIDVLIRAAFGGGAGVRMVPHARPLIDGVGAILRWRA